MSIRTLIEDYRRDFINKTTKTPCNLVLADWQLAQLIGELREVSDSEIEELNSFKDMKIIKLEETMFLAIRRDDIMK